MRVSLRAMVLWTFVLLALSSCVQGVLAIATTARSAQQVSTLERHSLEPAVSLALVSQYLDQERAFIALDLAHMPRARVDAVDAELTGLDDSIAAEAPRVLTPAALAQWRPAWPAYLAARARYLDVVPRGGARPVPATLLSRLTDGLNTVLDIVQTDAGTHLYAGQNLYRAAIVSDEDAIRGTVAGFIAALAIGAALAALIIRRLNRGLHNLLSTARAIIVGALHVRADESGGDEIAGLAAAFNHTTDALLSAERRADSDALTGLLNHRAFHSELTDEIARIQTDGGSELCVLVIDINNFKLFNDTYGHPVGDRVLTTFADLLRGECRATDRIARYGGDEFVLLAPHTGPDDGRALAHRLLDACARTAIRVREDAASLPLALSIGIAAAPEDAATALALMELADRRMFESKRSGGWLYTADDALPAVRLSPNAPFGVLDGLVTAIDHKDSYTREHSEWVARFADVLAQALDFDREARERLWMAALIHDVGKIGVPDRILRKPDRLTDEEYAVMKQHVVLSDLIIAQVIPGPDIVDAVWHHHERWDGRGYPHGIAGTDVPLHGRILIIADAASAMYMSRPYRKGLSLETMVDELRRNRGTQFDPTLTDLFVDALLAPSSPLKATPPGVTVAA